MTDAWSNVEGAIKLMQESAVVNVDGMLLVDKEVWGRVVDYVLRHKDDIKYGLNDFDELKLVLDYFNRNTE